MHLIQSLKNVFCFDLPMFSKYPATSINSYFYKMTLYLDWSQNQSSIEQGSESYVVHAALSIILSVSSSWMDGLLGLEDFLSLIYLMKTIPVGALKNQQSQQYLILL